MGDLQTDLQDLLKQKDALTEQLSLIPRFNDDKFYNAIKNQRWFFFKNKPNIIFDRDTALLWADLKSFPEPTEHSRYQLSEVQYLIDKTNSNGIDGFKNWRIPRPAELWKMIADKTFPYKERDYWRIKDRWHWCVFYNGQYQSKDLDYSGETWALGFNSVCVIPCSEELQTTNYEFYAEYEKYQRMLDIFANNNLEPIFNDASVTGLFSQVYIVKPNVQKQLAALEPKISKVQVDIDAKRRAEEAERRRKAEEEAKRKAEEQALAISPIMNLMAFKKKFDLQADTTPIRYSLSIINLTEYLLQAFNKYVAEKADVLVELNKISLSPEVVPNVKKVRADLKNFYNDALNIYSRLTGIGNLKDLDSVYKEVRPPFALVLETLIMKLQAVAVRVELFETMPNFVRAVCEPIRTTLSSRHHEKIRAADRTARDVILDLIRYVRKNHLQKKVGETTAAELALKKFQNYRESLKVLSETKRFKIDYADIAELVEVLKRNMQEVEDIVDDQSEKIWLHSKCVEILDF